MIRTLRSASRLLAVAATLGVVGAGCKGSSPSLSALAITPATATVAIGQTQALAVAGTRSDGSAQTITDPTWTTSTAGIATGKAQRFLTLPQTAITFNPYGNMVYLVSEEADATGKTKMVAKQTVVMTGQTRGDQIAILSGIKEGDRVVSAGQTKLQNGSQITVNNTIQPANDPNPQPRER